MPQIDVSAYQETDKLALLAAHLFERLDTLNTILAQIADRLDGMEQSMKQHVEESLDD